VSTVCRTSRLSRLFLHSPTGSGLALVLGGGRGQRRLRRWRSVEVNDLATCRDQLTAAFTDPLARSELEPTAITRATANQPDSGHQAVEARAVSWSHHSRGSSASFRTECRVSTTPGVNRVAGAWADGKFSERFDRGWSSPRWPGVTRRVVRHRLCRGVPVPGVAAVITGPATTPAGSPPNSGGSPPAERTTRPRPPPRRARGRPGPPTRPGGGRPSRPPPGRRRWAAR